jgi:hypothetical protein
MRFKVNSGDSEQQELLKRQRTESTISVAPLPHIGQLRQSSSS